MPTRYRSHLEVLGSIRYAPPRLPALQHRLNRFKSRSLVIGTTAARMPFAKSTIETSPIKPQTRRIAPTEIRAFGAMFERATPLQNQSAFALS
ncbi:hypothetical protein [Thalassococcus sp. S3]|uniref:hypothetical protein n=1 Tax=Thalassococcus sp. S3 TaxID=2017482 RepID=UPI00102407FA|nr:hypothetical protein [Thalassococcus sp. S3]QBF33456.1 hypothetical protein CFI11_19900 [Thalassococcus sp. S3]